MSISAMMMVQAAEARRRRDERGRYMEGGQEMRDMPDMRRYERGNTGEMTMAYSRIDDDGEEMRRGGRRTSMAYDRQPGREDRRRNEMGGEGYFTWDNANQPYMPPERYGQPVPRQNVTDMRQYRSRSMMGEHAAPMIPEKGMIGFGEPGEHEKKLTKEKAEKWVKGMRSGDPKAPKGGLWTMEDAKKLAKEYGIDEGQELVDFYAALNMMHSDYCEIAKEYGVDREDFYAAMACAFLWDSDGKRPSEKIAAYYKCVVPHDEED